MSKKKKLETPTWIRKGYDSPADYEKAIEKNGTAQCTPNCGVRGQKKGKIFKIRECPKCGSDEVGLVLSNSDAEQGGGKEWECRKCKWKGTDVVKKDLTEDELMKYMDEKGEQIA